MQEAYDLGWGQGYDDEPLECPYEEGSIEWDSFWDGYEQGCMDC